MRVQLPSTCTQEDLPVDNRQIVTAKKLKMLKYLDKFKLAMSVDDNQEVSLVIGANCVCALKPREVISSQKGGPYAFKTLLGWCVAGSLIDKIKAGKFSCNRIMLASADRVKPGRHYFTVPTKLWENSIENMSNKIFKHAFVETESQYSVNNKINLNYDNLSKHDRRFSELMEKRSCQD